MEDEKANEQANNFVLQKDKESKSGMKEQKTPG